MAIAGRLLRNRRAGDANLAWNLPNLAGPDTMTLTSQAFADGGAIPVEHAGRRAGGQNISPELSWTGVPDGCAQLLLVIEDIDAPTPKPFVHCVALIDASRSALEPGALAAEKPGALAAGKTGTGVQVLRSGMGRGYLGPEPIKGHGPHRYIFQLFALPIALTATPEQARPREVLPAVGGPVLARGRLTGTYER
jgi:Raf kinase inhibitor-like YbhB/YbcL family protein